MNWSVAQTESTRERIAQRWLAQAEFETYLPLIDGKVRPNPLFPGYLFIRIGNHGWARVENTIGVLQLLRTGDKPAMIADCVIEEIQSREHNGIVKLPERQRWRIGDRVRIGSGTFLGQIGLFDGMSAHERVFVLLNLFGRQTRTELAMDDLSELG